MSTHEQVSQQEADDLARLEKVILDNEPSRKDTVRALREIRDRRLWRGEYATFADYLNAKWVGVWGPRTPGWVSQQIVWLEVTEKLEAQNLKYELTQKDAEGLRSIVDNPDALTRVIQRSQEMQKSAPKRKWGGILKEQVKTEEGILGLKKSYDCTYEAASLVRNAQWGEGVAGMVADVVQDALDHGTDIADDLALICKEKEQLPARRELATLVPIDKLPEVIISLNGVWSYLEKKKALALEEKKLPSVKKVLAALTKGKKDPAPDAEVKEGPQDAPGSIEEDEDEEECEVSFVLNCKMSRKLADSLQGKTTAVKVTLDTDSGEYTVKGLLADLVVESPV